MVPDTIPDNTRAVDDKTLGQTPEWPPPFGGLPVAAERREHSGNFSAGSYEIVGFAALDEVPAAFENLAQAFDNFGMTVMEAISGLDWLRDMMNIIADIMPDVTGERDRMRSRTDVKQKRMEVAREKTCFSRCAHYETPVRTVRQRRARRVP